MWLELHEKPLRCGCSIKVVPASAEVFFLMLQLALSARLGPSIRNQARTVGMVRAEVLLRADTTNLCSVSGDILRVHTLACKPEQLWSAKRNTLHPSAGPCAVAGWQQSRLLVTKAQADVRGSFGFNACSPAKLGC